MVDAGLGGGERNLRSARDRRFAVGQVVAEAGPLNAATDMFEIELMGSGAHGARPHEAADPIVGAAALIGALQTIVSRRLNPASPAVVSVGSIHAGAASNVIPTARRSRARCAPLTPRSGRCYKTRCATSRKPRRHVTTCGSKSPSKGGPRPSSSRGTAGWARTAAANVLGEDAIVPLGFLNMGGEDFSFYLEKGAGRNSFESVAGRRVASHSSTLAALLCSRGQHLRRAAVLAETARVAAEALKGDEQPTASQLFAAGGSAPRS